MATTEEVEMGENVKEGKNLLGSPTFKQLENGRFKCVETGHELPQHAMDSYACSKRCRLGLVDFALSKNKSPLNMFSQDPLCRSKLICKLTGDTVNKSEEHIWMHINGKRFLNKLEQMEAGISPGDEKVELKDGKQDKENGKEKKKKKKKLKKKEKEMREDKKTKEIICEVRETPNDSDSDLKDPEFWMPPVGERWDFDDGGDRWASSGSESEGEHEDDHVAGTVCNEENTNDSTELSMLYFHRTKRTSIEVGPSSFASRKKKTKTKSLTSG